MITLLFGDRFLVGRAARRLLAERLAPGLRDFNLDLFDGAEASAESILRAVRSLPLLSQRRVVLVRDAEGLRKGEIDRLEGLEVPDTTDLILTAGKVDRRIRFWQKILAEAKVQEFRPLSPRDAAGWVVREAQALRVSLTPEAVQALIQAVGTDAALLAAALEKIALARCGISAAVKEGGGSPASDPKSELGSSAGPPPPSFTAADISACVAGFSWKNVFDLTQAVGDRDLGRALKLLNGMVAGGESLVALVALLARHFRILFRLKEGTDDPSVPPFFRKDYVRQAGRFRPEELAQGLDQIFRADWDLKSSPLSGALIVERLLSNLCRAN